MHLRRRAPGARALASCRSTASAFPPKTPTTRRGKIAKWLDALARSADVRAVSRPRRGRRSAAEEQSAAAARQGASSSRAHWARGAAGRQRAPARPIRATSCRFRRVYRMEEIDRHLAQRSTRRCCGWRRPNRDIPHWLAGDADGDAGSRRTRRRAAALAHVRRRRLVTIGDAGHMLHHDQPARWRAAIEPFLAAVIASTLTRRASRQSQRGAYVLLGAADAAVGHQLDCHEARARARASGGVQRPAHAGSPWRRCSPCCSRGAARCLPQSWLAVIVTGFFQTTINFGSTTMAVAGGGAGRASVLVFTMPFWTLLHRVAGAARARARLAVARDRCSPLRGLVLVVAAVALARRSRAASVGGAVGIRLGGGHGRHQVFPARRRARHARTSSLADGGRRASADAPAAGSSRCPRRNGASRTRCCCSSWASSSTGARIPALDGECCAGCPPARRRSTCSRSR